jgi:hypothetical protein
VSEEWKYSSSSSSAHTTVLKMAVLCSKLYVSGFDLVEHGDEEGVGREHADVHIGHTKGQCGDLSCGVRCSAVVWSCVSKVRVRVGVCVGVEVT